MDELTDEKPWLVVFKGGDTGVYEEDLVERDRNLGDKTTYDFVVNTPKFFIIRGKGNLGELIYIHRDLLEVT